MTATAGRLVKMDDYLRQIEEQLQKKGVKATERSDILAELKSHLIDRTAEFQVEGSPDAVGQALAALGDPIEIASELAATANLRTAGNGFSPASLLAAAWSMARKFGRGVRLFLVGLLGYILSLGCLIVTVMKIALPNKSAFGLVVLGWCGAFLPRTPGSTSWLVTGLFQSHYGWLSYSASEPRCCCVDRSDLSWALEIALTNRRNMASK